MYQHSPRVQRDAAAFLEEGSLVRMQAPAQARFSTLYSILIRSRRFCSRYVRDRTLVLGL